MKDHWRETSVRTRPLTIQKKKIFLSSISITVQTLFSNIPAILILFPSLLHSTFWALRIISFYASLLSPLHAISGASGFDLLLPVMNFSNISTPQHLIGT
ncbi:hypothetical protein F4818DRAFT_428616 [Hypoxylon cercidicola]|nr:hypothetical protein F4818DRAFT_428616 [Hypoxylon cercidicola]